MYKRYSLINIKSALMVHITSVSNIFAEAENELPLSSIVWCKQTKQRRDNDSYATEEDQHTKL